ncbi:cholesterol catabolism transcriptional regulator KstR [Tsukamurella sp. 8F]|uniref:cholesterol catabolism transcriptional regulator KstR n=1 Tax=unclassified Tsukamurella TaxID=2633480 RepID=UPI0023B9E874|nr:MULTISPECIES: cholesterol catabolism transcriptional regulator KstR [unclassified Tsukamurella]MDF0530749.1 cholesterol catabolism transcriptional regulator KstR [Tsukamurella sp. 8J]MDF0587950.1 cholesterol catabolism transcriptional regulator KstR [Tsukamurella sp. 8F]
MAPTEQAVAGAPSREDLDSAAQRERRKRIVDATLSLARKGGYEAVQMRAVAKKADVALGTLYRYFPSKIHLLVAGLVREFESAQEKLDKSPIPGETPKERVLFVLERNTRMLQRAPLLTEAMVRAFMFADATAAAEVETVGRLLESMFARAMGEDDPTPRERDAFRLIADVWMANLVAWVTHRASATDVQKRLEVTVDLVIDD